MKSIRIVRATTHVRNGRRHQFYADSSPLIPITKSTPRMNRFVSEIWEENPNKETTTMLDENDKQVPVT